MTKHGQMEHIAVQFHITHEQYQREETLSQSCDVLISDSPLFLSYIYGLLAMDSSSETQIKILKEIYGWSVLKQLDRYDHVFFLPRQFEVVDDGLRQVEHTEAVESAILGFLSSHKHLFPRFSEIWSEKEDPKEILADRVTKISAILEDQLSERPAT